MTGKLAALGKEAHISILHLSQKEHLVPKCQVELVVVLKMQKVLGMASNHKRHNKKTG